MTRTGCLQSVEVGKKSGNSTEFTKRSYKQKGKKNSWARLPIQKEVRKKSGKNFSKACRYPIDFVSPFSFRRFRLKIFQFSALNFQLSASFSILPAGHANSHMSSALNYHERYKFLLKAISMTYIFRWWGRLHSLNFFGRSRRFNCRMFFAENIRSRNYWAAIQKLHDT